MPKNETLLAVLVMALAATLIAQRAQINSLQHDLRKKESIIKIYKRTMMRMVELMDGPQLFKTLKMLDEELAFEVIAFQNKES